MSKLSREEIFKTADLLYFGFMEFLCDSDRDEFIIDDETDLLLTIPTIPHIIFFFYNF